MKPEMRLKLAREPFEEKVRKVAQLIRLAKAFPKRTANFDASSQPVMPPATPHVFR